MKDAKHLVFVYGTLCRGMMLHKHLANSRFIEEGAVSGTLYDLGCYPALSLRGEGLVGGEIWEIDEDTLKVLDLVEGYDGSSCSLFIRKKVDIASDSGLHTGVYVYVGNMNFDGCDIIRNGVIASYPKWVGGYCNKQFEDDIAEVGRLIDGE